MPQKIKIVADRDIPYLEGVLEPYAEVIYLAGKEISLCDTAAADALVIRTRTRCDGALLAGSRVKMIATATIGYDHIDMEYCASHDIEVATSAGCNARGVLQWIGAVLRELSLSGRIGAPQDTTLGVVGVGNVGSLVARYAALWGFRVLCCDPPRVKELAAGIDRGLYVPPVLCALDEVARQADVVTFHVPLTRSGEDRTGKMAGRKFFETLKQGAVVVNSSRGEIVDRNELLAAAMAGDCYYIIDTWENEPEIDGALLQGTLLATPHIAGYSVQGKANGTAMAVRSLARHFGWPLEGWYPSQAERQTPRDITWGEMCERMPSYFDIAALSRNLKTTPEEFEAMRNDYVYRHEFF